LIPEYDEKKKRAVVLLTNSWWKGPAVASRVSKPFEEKQQEKSWNPLRQGKKKKKGVASNLAAIGGKFVTLELRARSIKQEETGGGGKLLYEQDAREKNRVANVKEKIPLEKRGGNQPISPQAGKTKGKRISARKDLTQKKKGRNDPCSILEKKGRGKRQPFDGRKKRRPKLRAPKKWVHGGRNEAFV